MRQAVRSLDAFIACTLALQPLRVAIAATDHTRAPAKVQEQVHSLASPHAANVMEAARRFALPERWIWAVMRQESAANPTAVSRAGAMGLMQIMPATWAQLRAELGLGNDPFDPRDNIIAGTAYLRAMYDRYGQTGMLAAYNAGPGRYEDHVRLGKPLPVETRAYLARLLPIVGDSTPPVMPTAKALQPSSWIDAALFPQRTTSPRAAAAREGEVPVVPMPNGPIVDAAAASVSLFISRTGSRP